MIYNYLVINVRGKIIMDEFIDILDEKTGEKTGKSILKRKRIKMELGMVPFTY